MSVSMSEEIRIHYTHHLVVNLCNVGRFTIFIFFIDWSDSVHIVHLEMLVFDGKDGGV